MEEEVWKDVKEYEGLYEVSNIGDVRKKEGVFRYTGKNLKPGRNSCGYLTVSLFKNNIAKTYALHRILAIAFIVNPENKPQVNHINGVRHDNRIENLEWVTRSENTIHAIKLGLKTYECTSGENSHKSKLKKEQIADIRRYYNEFKGTKKHNVLIKKTLIKKYSVSYTCVSNIVTKKTWKCI